MNAVLPGGTIGILGGGQLGRMLALVARRMGYKIIVLDPTPGCPASFVADKQVIAPFDDVKAALLLAEESDVVTFEFESIPWKTVEALEKSGKRVFPSSFALKTSQDRLVEKEFFNKSGVKTTSFAKVVSQKDFDNALKKIGLPAVIKTTTGGYDGHGQVVAKTRAEAEKAFLDFKGVELIWESKVDFIKELSVICSRGLDGSIVSYPVCENTHSDGILDTTLAPARVSKKAEENAKSAAEKIAVGLKLVGVMCVEFFLLKDDGVLANEMAPRPHNSGHFSIDACECSQFEQQLRAICGLPLGSTKMFSPYAVMVNVLGSGESKRLSGVEKLLENPSLRWHWYGKRQAKEKRKMGHYTILASNADEALVMASKEKKNLAWSFFKVQ